MLGFVACADLRPVNLPGFVSHKICNVCFSVSLSVLLLKVRVHVGDARFSAVYMLRYFGGWMCTWRTCTYVGMRWMMHLKMDLQKLLQLQANLSNQGICCVHTCIFYVDILLYITQCFRTCMFYREPSLDWAEVLVLPSRFSTATTVAIETGVLTKSARNEIVDSLATLMLTYTSRPTSQDFTIICRRLMEKYPQLRDMIDEGYVSIKNIDIYTHTPYWVMQYFRVLGNWNYELNSRICVGLIVLRKQALLFHRSHLSQKRWKWLALQLLLQWQFHVILMMRSTKNTSTFFSGRTNPRNGPW